MVLVFVRELVSFCLMAIHGYFMDYVKCPINKCGFFSLDKAAQEFAGRRTLCTSHPAPMKDEGLRHPAENAVQRKKDHLWMDNN